MRQQLREADRRYGQQHGGSEGTFMPEGESESEFDEDSEKQEHGDGDEADTEDTVPSAAMRAALSQQAQTLAAVMHARVQAAKQAKQAQRLHAGHTGGAEQQVEEEDEQEGYIELGDASSDSGDGDAVGSKT